MTKNYKICWLLLAIIALGSFLRVYQLNKQSYWMDEGYTVNAVISAAHNGYDRGSSILDSGGRYFCPLYCYPTEIITRIAGDNTWSYRTLAVLAGIFFIFLVYLITKVIFKNNKAALLAAGFTSFSYWQIAWSRQARWYTLLEVFFWAALLLFYLFLKAKNKKQKIISLLLSLFFTILAIATHKLAYLLPLIMLGGYFILNRPTKKQALISIIAAGGVIAFVEFGLGLHFITHALKNISFHYNLPYYLSFYLRNYWLFIALAIYGYFASEKEQKQKIIFLALPFLVYLVFLSFLTNIIHYRYLFPLTAALYIIASIVIIDISGKIRQNYGKIIGLFLLILVFFISRQGVIFPKDYYFLEADDPSELSRPYYAYTPQPDFNAAYAAIKGNLKSEEIVISSHPHFNKIFLNQPGDWIKYDYLGMEDTPKTIKDNKEYYVGATVINNLEELKKITATKHGYLVFDYMAADDKIKPEIISYIQNNLELFFFNEKNSYSKIWVYRF